MSDNRFALLIGNGDYQDDKLRSLNSPSHDVEDLRRVLEDPNIGGFKSVDVVMNESVAMVRRSISYFFAQKDRDDLLMVYFSGHGIVDKDDGTLYLAVKNTEYDLPSATSIEAQFITREMNKRKLRRVVIVLDCCYSGAFDRGLKGASIPDLGMVFNSGYGRYILTASNAIEEAWDGSEIIVGATRSLFTHFLIEGLESGEAGGKFEWITIDNLYKYIYSNVVKTPKPNPQTPQIWGDQQEGNPIVIAHNPRYSKNLVPVIAVMGARGGVGKTTIVARVAELIAESGHNSLVIDLDTTTAGSTVIHRRRSNSILGNVKTVFDHLFSLNKNQQEHFGEGISNSLLDVTPRYLRNNNNFGKIYLLPARRIDKEMPRPTFTLLADIDQDDRNKVLLNEIEVMLKRCDELNNKVHCVLIDCGAEGPDHNPLVAAAFRRANWGYIIAQPDDVCRQNIADNLGLIQYQFADFDPEKILLIVNRVTNVFEEDQARNLFQPYYVAGVIPDDPKIFQDMQLGELDFSLGYDGISRAVQGIIKQTLPVQLVPDEWAVWLNPWIEATINRNVISKYLKTSEFLRSVVRLSITFLLSLIFLIWAAVYVARPVNFEVSIIQIDKEDTAYLVMHEIEEGQSFVYLASKYSTHLPTAGNGGKLEQLVEMGNRLPDFGEISGLENCFKTTPVGSVCNQLLQLDNNFYILKLNASDKISTPEVVLLIGLLMLCGFLYQVVKDGRRYKFLFYLSRLEKNKSKKEIETLFFQMVNSPKRDETFKWLYHIQSYIRDYERNYPISPRKKD